VRRFQSSDLLYPFAPKPLLIGASDKDSFGTYSPRYLSNGWEEYLRLESVYRTLGHADRIAWTDSPLPHGLSYDSRLSTYNWFRRWLQHRPEPLASEPEVKPEPDTVLWVSEGGNVVKAWKGETPRSMLLTQCRTLASAARGASMPLDALLGAEKPSAAPPVVLGRVASRGLAIEAIEAQSGSVWLPAWLFIPAENDPAKPAILIAEAAGRNVRWHEDELYQRLARRGFPVCAADVRGIGDLTPEIGRGNPHYARSHADEDSFAWASLIFGRPLAGQRASDLLALAAALRSHLATKGHRLRLAANARLTAPALFAAALDPRIDEVYLADALLSYQDVVETEEYGAAFANFVPGILRHTDLPAVAASISPRRVILAGAINAAGDKVDLQQVRRIYASANVEVRPTAPWDEAALAWS